jgi:hypothetical protein
MSDRTEFLAGERPDDVAFFLSDAFVDDPEALAGHGEVVDDGVVVVVDGETGRGAFQSAAGIDPMQFSREAMDVESHVDRDLTGGDCPAGEGEDHRVAFVFAFSEAHNEEVGGLYAEGDVVHAYARCLCGESYSDRWVAEDG